MNWVVLREFDFTCRDRLGFGMLPRARGLEYGITERGLSREGLGFHFTSEHSNGSGLYRVFSPVL